MKAFLAVLITLLPLGAIANEANPAPSPYVSSQPGLEVSATRGQVEGTFEVAAVISDAGTGKVLASPTMTVRAGEWARASMGAPGAEVEFSATVDPSGQLVAFLAKASQAGGDRKTYSGTFLVMP